METYANVLLIALPSFLVLILIEIIYGIWKKDLTYNLMDTISSLSSGTTNMIKDLLGIGFIIITYPYILENIALIKLEGKYSPIYYSSCLYGFCKLLES
jgi:hypothetical protein